MINFTIRKSARARNVRLQMDSNGKITVVAPRLMPKFLIRQFVQDHTDWIKKRLAKVKKKDPDTFYYLGEAHTEEEIMKRAKGDLSTFYKKKANEIIRDRLEHFNEHYQFHYNRVTFRNQKTRWGSCSAQKNLNFNWRLAMAPIQAIDYVVVHELCHLQELNHSKQYWALVAQAIPDHKKWRKWIRENQHLLKV